MCKFASFVLTKDEVYWSDKSESHTAICEEFHLKEDNHRNEPQLLMCELLPTTDLDDFASYNCNWDQDVKPDWFVAEVDERRVRVAMNQRFPKGIIEYADSLQVPDTLTLTAKSLATAGNVTVSGKFDAPLLATAGNVYVYASGKFDAPLLKR